MSVGPGTSPEYKVGPTFRMTRRSGTAASKTSSYFYLCIHYNKQMDMGMCCRALCAPRHRWPSSSFYALRKRAVAISSSECTLAVTTIATLDDEQGPES
jgi:hypothetical protein